MKKDAFKLRLFNLLADKQELTVKNGINEEYLFDLLKDKLSKLKLAEDVLTTLNFKIHKGEVITNESWLRQTNPEVYSEIVEKRRIEEEQRMAMGVND